MSKISSIEENPNNSDCLYSMESKRGAGREIILKLKQFIDKEMPTLKE